MDTILDLDLNAEVWNRYQYTSKDTDNTRITERFRSFPPGSGCKEIEYWIKRRFGPKPKQIYQKTLPIKKADICYYNQLMAHEQVDYDKEGLPARQTIQAWTAEFPKGYEIDLKINPCDDGSAPWCEWVLLQNGHECCCSDAECRIPQTITMEHNGKTFNITITEN